MASPHDLPMDNQSLFTQRMVLVYNIFCEAFVSEPDPPELPAKIIACISIVTLLFLICNHILNVTLAWLLGVIPEHDLEGGDIIYGPRIDILDSSPFRIAIVQNTQRLGVMTRVMPDFDEGRGPRLRALKKLPPLLNYGSCEIRSTSSSRCTACAICLEDFADGDSCQIFSLCNHMFHSNCIDHWLMNKPTCPVCRNCIMDV
ncbi:RING-H2 finger protein ATL19 [Pyrus ussuriensis x Pyrus communis]|uniref:RING-H2 finger protein ATL19 n=1 Tax=Pyrus ussuriensis x Pyrus communis TaxID=2448454 RepID=A0A5N5G504_9ROSA|nr:RING-H2 finger protein ATL19 [Pyrus ussuriensis x Pyrus communis]